MIIPRGCLAIQVFADSFSINERIEVLEARALLKAVEIFLTQYATSDELSVVFFIDNTTVLTGVEKSRSRKFILNAMKPLL